MIQTCADLVHAGDPERFAATMAAPVALREKLWPLYAANLEIARAPWAASEPMVAEMRLQWWIDTIAELAAGSDRRGHPVTEALAPLLQADPALAPLLTGIAEARRWDCWREAFADRTAFDAYLDRTSGNLMWAAARTLGAPGTSEAPVRDFAWGAGLAAYLRAAPELEARGRIPLHRRTARRASRAGGRGPRPHRAGKGRRHPPGSEARALARRFGRGGAETGGTRPGPHRRRTAWPFRSWRKMGAAHPRADRALLILHFLSGNTPGETPRRRRRGQRPHAGLRSGASVPARSATHPPAPGTAAWRY